MPSLVTPGVSSTNVVDAASVDGEIENLLGADHLGDVGFGLVDQRRGAFHLHLSRSTGN